TVDQEEVEALDPGLHHLRDLPPQLEPVGVPPDGGDRGDRLELGEEGRRADVAGVQDQIDIAEDLKDLWAEQAVGVGDQAKAHEGPHARGENSPSAIAAS